MHQIHKRRTERSKKLHKWQNEKISSCYIYPYYITDFERNIFLIFVVELNLRNFTFVSKINIVLLCLLFLLFSSFCVLIVNEDFFQMHNLILPHRIYRQHIHKRLYICVCVYGCIWTRLNMPHIFIIFCRIYF